MKRILSVCLALMIMMSGTGFAEGVKFETKQILINKINQLKSILIQEVNKKIGESGSKKITPIEPIKYKEVKVKRVVDGDTFTVVINGKEEKVRMVGVNTPESVGDYKDNPQPFSKEASDFTKEQLEGKNVYLESDVGERDKYGRLLCYVWLKKPSQENVKTDMFNAVLLDRGMASVMTIPPNVKYQELFVRLERSARESNIGLWALK